MSLGNEVERIKSELANIGSKIITDKTIEELVEEIIKEVK